MRGLWPTARFNPLPLASLLARVSRSFYLSLWLLPVETRETIALAYLLARAADTVADTRLVPKRERIRLLSALSEAVQGGSSSGELGMLLGELGELGDPDNPGAEQRLLGELGGCLILLQRQSPLERRLIRRVLDLIIKGMRTDLERFPGESASELRALESREELLDYCYHVAGCVGEFWSELHARRLKSLASVPLEDWKQVGLRLGRALQLTNVLRDVQRDLSHGRCYLPRKELAKFGLDPEDLLQADSWGRARPLFEEWVAQALSDARAGLEHAIQIPLREVGLRQAELLPLFLAVRTLGLVLQDNPLSLSMKVARRDVYETLGSSLVAAGSGRALRWLFKRTVREAGLDHLQDAPC